MLSALHVLVFAFVKPKEAIKVEYDPSKVRWSYQCEHHMDFFPHVHFVITSPNAIL